MHEAAPVHGLERREQRVEERGHEGGLQHAVAAQRVGEGLAFEQLHHQVRGAVGLGARVEHVYEVRVLNLSGGLRFAHEALDRLGGPVVFALEHFHGEAPPGHDVLRLVDGPHAPFADASPEPVALRDDRAFVHELPLFLPVHESVPRAARRSQRAPGPRNARDQSGLRLSRGGWRVGVRGAMFDRPSYDEEKLSHPSSPSERGLSWSAAPRSVAVCIEGR